MIRLTQNDEQGRWCVRGISWDEIQPGGVISREVWETAYACFCKLKDYENTGLDPGEVEDMKDEIEDLNSFLKSEAAKLLMELQKERRKSRWIPAGEEMPPEDGDYLVTMIIPRYSQGRPVTNWLSWDAEKRRGQRQTGLPLPKR